MSWRVQLNCSTRPHVWGWCTVVMNFSSSQCKLYKVPHTAFPPKKHIIPYFPHRLLSPSHLSLPAWLTPHSYPQCIHSVVGVGNLDSLAGVEDHPHWHTHNSAGPRRTLFGSHCCPRTRFEYRSGRWGSRIFSKYFRDFHCTGEATSCFT